MCRLAPRAGSKAWQSLAMMLLPVCIERVQEERGKDILDYMVEWTVADLVSPFSAFSFMALASGLLPSSACVNPTALNPFLASSCLIIWWLPLLQTDLHELRFGGEIGFGFRSTPVVGYGELNKNRTRQQFGESLPWWQLPKGRELERGRAKGAVT